MVILYSRGGLLQLQRTILRKTNRQVIDVVTEPKWLERSISEERSLVGRLREEGKPLAGRTTSD